MIYNVQNSSPDIDVAGKLFSYGVNGKMHWITERGVV